jgi:hypothetical protein
LEYDGTKDEGKKEQCTKMQVLQSNAGGCFLLLVNATKRPGNNES